MAVLHAGPKSELLVENWFGASSVMVIPAEDELPQALKSVMLAMRKLISTSAGRFTQEKPSCIIGYPFVRKR